MLWNTDNPNKFPLSYMAALDGCCPAQNKKIVSDFKLNT